MSLLSCFAFLVAVYRAFAHEEDGHWVQLVLPGDDPGSREGASSAVIGGAWYVLGGDQKQGGFLYYSTDKLVPEINAWIHLGPQGRLPTNFVYSDMDSVGGMLFLFGGQNPVGNSTGYFNDVLIIHPSDPNSNWQTVKQLIAVPQRSAHTATHVSGLIYVFGGWNSSAYFNDLWSFDTTQLYLNSASSVSWVQIIPNNRPPPARNGHTAVSAAGGLWIFGGFSHSLQNGPWVSCTAPGDNCVYYNDLWRYDGRSNTWTKMNPSGDIPTGRWGHSADVLGNRMLVFGGNTPIGNVVNDIYSYDFTNNQWQLLQVVVNAPSPRFAHVSGVIGSNLYIYGGSGGVNDVWRFTLNVEQTYSTNVPELMGITGAAIFLVIVIAAIGILTLMTWRKLKAQTTFEAHGDIQTGSLDD